jgi:hypothetical protein
MTFTVRIELTVSNFDSWKMAFESDPLGRQKSGVRRYRILKPTDDPNYVMVDFEFDGLKDAENFGAALRNMWASPAAKNLIQNSKLRIVEQVETKEY